MEGLLVRGASFGRRYYVLHEARIEDQGRMSDRIQGRVRVPKSNVLFLQRVGPEC